MANNEERFCNHCKKETTFYQESDLIWYCDECENPYGSEPLSDMNSDEFNENLEAFEEENGPSIYCKICGNFIPIESILSTDCCPVCSEEIDESQMEEKGYELNDDCEWVKIEEQKKEEAFKSLLLS